MAEPSDESRYDRGMAFFEAVHPDAARAMRNNLGEIAPDLLRYIAEFPFGDLYSRDGLDQKLRQTATLAALATGGHMTQLKIHLEIARRMGFSTDELVEILMQITPYAGFPAAINAVMTLKDVVESCPVLDRQSKKE
ncbi:carboxymuconolactone decarboxylase family protein [Salinisphaera sp. P385]|uniref:Carboxymuconolactone decarboxylase family protein n=1 Tax=Spectribacter acetivorans TaxID=3075603 RepID=A0ABU3B803_9GAMM|nr:carboxymuconolactone decarboxylase family protein [Salinisphaera sp. P385]MDT0618604.1 carboxymuconolactone decarboxylase family protein [Salinisphaera sp. P385]